MHRRNTRVSVAGIITPGTRITPSSEEVLLPTEQIAPGELVFRLGSDVRDLGLAAGDLLIVEPRQDAASGEVVIATLAEGAFLGRWWTKHGTRMLVDGACDVITDAPELRVLGAVTLIARVE